MRTTNHTKVEVVSCFRSTGSMPVPKPVTLVIPNYTPHQQRNKRKVVEEAIEVTELVFKHATIHETEDVEEEIVDTLTSTHSKETKVIIRDTDTEMLEICKVIVVDARTCDPEPPSEPVPKKKDNQSCKKHSRCHCALLSLDTSEFFNIKV